MTNKEKLLQAVVDMVPQWFEGSSKELPTYKLNIEEQKISFVSHRRLTPSLSKILMYISQRLEGWLSQLPKDPTPSSINKIREEIALEWLSLCSTEEVQWHKLIGYLEALSYRTYENIPISTNLLISQGDGLFDLTDDAIQKILDPLACSLHTYFRINRNLQFVGYEEISWKAIKDTSGYKFTPEFLQPFASILQSNEFSVHLTNRNDLAVISKGGIIASCRKGKWYIYDPSTMKNSIVSMLGEYYTVGCNLFEVFFDLSYKRHGSLLVFDPHHKVINHIVNSGSRIDLNSSTSDTARQMLRESIKSINVSGETSSKRNKRLLLEIASLDGAVVFDKHSILAFGAMIDSHPEVGNHSGARTTAFHSAFLWGGYPAKISSDGDISIYFEYQFDGAQCKSSRIDFM